MRLPRWLKAVLLAVAAAACRTASPPAAPVVQPGAPGEASRVIDAPAAAAIRLPSFTGADVKFMQGMIHHHAQALDMTGLLRTRTNGERMKQLAQRIELSQKDEIDMMRRWLEARGQEPVGEHALHMPGAPMMPGMLTPEQMAQLAAATGPAFDRLFLEFMIRHHEGALTMVRELFATPGAAQEPDVFAFASEVDADQRMEITRMRALLKEQER